LCNFLQSSVTSSLFGPNILLSTHTNSKQNLLLYILVYMFLNREQRDKYHYDLIMNDSKCHPNCSALTLFVSNIEFSVVHKYFNFLKMCQLSSYHGTDLYSHSETRTHNTPRFLLDKPAYLLPFISCVSFHGVNVVAEHLHCRPETTPARS
jgi:hypothetical protein